MPPPTNIHRILLIRADYLGDMVCAMPVLESLRAAYPEAYLAVMASPLNAPLVEGHPAVSEVILFDRRGKDSSLRRKLAVALQIRTAKFDLIYALNTKTITAFSDAPYRVGYVDDRKYRLRFQRLTHALRGGHAWGGLYEVERNIRLLDALDIPPVTRKPRLFLTDAERTFATTWLEAHGISPDAPLIGVHPGASKVCKCYPPDRYGIAATTLAQELGESACVLVFGGPGDVERVAQVTTHLSVPYASVIGRTVREMMTLMTRCDLMLLNDSGPMHVAAALDVPFVTVFGPTDYERWMPRTETARLVRPNSARDGALPVPPKTSVIEGIPAVWVIEAGRELLHSKRTSHE